uniref:FXNA-like protease n=1 Tax=Enterobius vermicularis TaxID=51028 RepID=A0A0N4UX35_ENTVE
LYLYGRFNKSCFQKKDALLGFRHWLIILLVIGLTYGFIVFQDNRMPNVVEKENLEKFSEARARDFLTQVTRLGPRPSGSNACEVGAVELITDRLKKAEAEVKSRGRNRFEFDFQYPSGCYDLKFLSSFTLCYHKITNIVARIGPKTPSKHAILLNCHFDTLPDCPGATDDAVSCAIMIEVMELLARSNSTLENDVVFLFNGAEENFLQASHGFITQHPWRHYIRAFINLEGAGAGGREILFQAGPKNSWLLRTYLENVPYPHCSVFAQEIFQAGIVPSDTDFRVFRDFGHIPGLDIAYFRNGWVYHTEFDLPSYIKKGCIQRAGENILALTKVFLIAVFKAIFLFRAVHFIMFISLALMSSPNLEKPVYDDSGEFVFYDLLGFFAIFYPASYGVVLNYFTVALVLGIVLIRVHSCIYEIHDLLTAFVHHAITSVAMLAFGLIIVTVVTKMGLIMCWYKMPELVFPLYMFPLLLTGCSVHNIIAHRRKMRNGEMVHYDSMLVIYAALLALTTLSGFASSFFLLIHVIFPLLRDPLLYALGKLRIIRVITVGTLLKIQLLCTLPVMVFGGYAVMLLFEFFVPVTGRLGNAVNPEYIVMLTAFITTTSNLMYVSRRLDYLLKCGFALFIFFFAILMTTSIGWPYHYSEGAPRLRRMIALDAKRTVYSYNSNKTEIDNGLFLQAFDYRGINDFPEHAFLTGKSKPDCSGIQDEYCRLPYYTAIHELFPPEESRWVPLPNMPYIENPLELILVNKQIVGQTGVRYELTLKGGCDKTSLHITPLNGFALKQWSFTNLDIETFGKRRTYFVFLSYGRSAPSERRFWILLETNLSSDAVPFLEISAASHYAHGPHQNSDALRQLRNLISYHRSSLHSAIGMWKWASTMIGGVSEIIVRSF